MESTTFHSSWTLAEALIWEIAARLKNGRTFWLMGNKIKYYWEFESIVRVLQGMLDDEEKREATEKEEEIVPLLDNPVSNKIQLNKLLKEYDAMVMKFLHTHKLDVPQRKDRKKLIA